jgi:hypothetical protein
MLMTAFPSVGQIQDVPLETIAVAHLPGTMIDHCPKMGQSMP